MTDETDDAQPDPNNVLPFQPPTVKVSLKLDPQLLDKFRVSEPGWQRRINDALKAALNDDSKS